MSQTIHIRGIHAEGRHGASAGEQDRPQPFLVDLEIAVEALGDELGTTSDYRVVVYAVQDLVGTRSFALIETLATEIAQMVLGIPGVRTCRATVHKPRAAQRLGVDGISASADART